MKDLGQTFNLVILNRVKDLGQTFNLVILNKVKDLRPDIAEGDASLHSA